MKKIFKLTFIFVLSLALFSVVKVNAATPTLEEIATKFNNSSEVANYHNETGGNLVASIEENTLTVTSTTQDSEIGPAIVAYGFTLEGTVWSGSVSSDEHGLYIFQILLDSIGQLYGYEEGELVGILDSPDIGEYTLETEGFEQEIGTGYKFKIDLSKKIPLEKASSTGDDAGAEGTIGEDDSIDGSTTVKVPNTAQGITVNILIIGALLVIFGTGIITYALRKRRIRQEQQ